MQKLFPFSISRFQFRISHFAFRYSRLALVLVAAQASGLAAEQLESCKIAGVARVAECVTMRVPEDRSTLAGRTIDLNVVVLKPASPRQPDPVLFFAGGPGQGAATLAAGIAREADPIAPDRDIVLIDQRGTGRSNLLTCDGGFLIAEATRQAELHQCREALGRVANLDHYGTDEAVEDAAHVVKTLGYTRVNVGAASYGTRVALRFMARYPSLVRSSVLRAAAPTDFHILRDGARQAQAALEQVFGDCRQDAACREAFPHAASDLEALRERLRTTPDPISADALDRARYALLLSTSTRQIMPWLVHTASAGDTTALAAAAASVEAIYKTVAIGQYLSVVCSEDPPPDRAADNGRFDAGTRVVVAACATWNVARTAKPARKRLSQPTLVLSGAVDPAMPPAIGERTLRDLSRGTHVVLPATAHGPMFPGCAADLTKAFIASGGAAKMDTKCLNELKLPPWKTW